jgi:hypothetical protein
LETNKRYYISVISVFDGNHLSYVPIEISIDPIIFYRNPFIMFPLSSAIISLALISFYFWNKYKVTKKKLDSEVKEVSVVVAGSDDMITRSKPNIKQYVS